MNPLFILFTKSNWDTCLTKCVPRTMLEKTVQDVLTYMLDSNPDDLNPGYTAADSRLLEVATQNYQQGISDSNFGFEIAYLNKEKNPVKLSLKDRLIKCPDAIHEKEDLLENTGRFDEIQLLYDYKEVGGIYVDPKFLTRTA